MSLYRGRLYSVEDTQKLIIEGLYREELQVYNIEACDEVSEEFITDNLIDIANVVLLLGISRLSNDFIDTTEFNLIYDRVLVYIKNRDLLGDLKVYNKLMQIIKDLYYKPFVAYT